MKEVHPESGKCFHFDNGSHSPTLVSLLDSRQKEGSLRRKSARQPSFSTWVVASQTKVKESCVVSEATDTRHTRFIPWFLMRELKTSWRREEKESRLLRHTLSLCSSTTTTREQYGNEQVKQLLLQGIKKRTLPASCFSESCLRCRYSAANTYCSQSLCMWLLFLRTSYSLTSPTTTTELLWIHRECRAFCV